MDLREVDVLVAGKVLGMRVERVRPPWYQGGRVEVLCFYAPGFDHMEYSYDANSCNAMMYRNGRDSSDGTAPSLPYYSDDIAAAWQVVEKLREALPQIDVEILADRVTVTLWEQCRHNGGALDPLDEVEADTVPLAICRAALKAVGVVPESV